MRTRTAYLWFVSLMWIIVVEEVQAFYNPGTGRWLSRDPIAEPLPVTWEARDSAANLYCGVRNNAVNNIDLWGLLVFLKNECQGCNGGTHNGLHTCKENPAGIYVPGAFGSFNHSCTTSSGGLCDTETHVYIRAKNESCFEWWFVVCSYSYEGTASGKDNVFLNVTRFMFLGVRVAAKSALMAYAPQAGQPGPPYTVSLTHAGAMNTVVRIQKGKEIVVFELQPRVRTDGGSQSITEQGQVSCSAAPLPF